MTKRSNFISVEKFQQAKKFSRQTKGQEILRALSFEKRLFDFRRNGGVVIVQASRKLSNDAMLASEHQHASPVHGRKILLKPFFVAPRTNAFSQRDPFALERADVGEPLRRKHFSHGDP